MFSDNVTLFDKVKWVFIAVHILVVSVAIIGGIILCWLRYKHKRGNVNKSK